MKIGKHNIDGKACIMGVLNVTPDSFSDGGSYTSVEKALEQAEKMLQQMKQEQQKFGLFSALKIPTNDYEPKLFF